uniref:Multiple epidermal growth factor-like domains protein 6 n=1 Tax=Crassostrea virginica TaxID=6565 RepID=A0A8B8AKI6_CRAVI|nr:multiple epidermal growth factor-like domains protein 6 [Crassostrea virginica]
MYVHRCLILCWLLEHKICAFDYSNLLNFHFPGSSVLSKNQATPCSYPLFGKGCIHQCQCSKEHCDPNTGCQAPVINCPDGFKGSYCENRCSFPRFGYGCQQVCLCSRKHCHFITGCQFKQIDVRPPSKEQGHSIVAASAKEDFSVPVTSIVLTTLIVSNARQNKTSDELNSLNLNGTSYQFTDALTEDETFEKTIFSVKENTTLGIVFSFN